MMAKTLLLVGAAVVAGQPTCNNNCTGNGANCALTNSYCYRSLGSRNVTACDTSSMTCTGDSCAAGTNSMDGTTCSKCADTCGSNANNATCTATTSCLWAAQYCVPVTTPTPAPCAASTSATCTGMAGCFWLSVSSTTCTGPAVAYSTCYPCNGTSLFGTVVTRSALANNVGKTCTWAKVSPYTYSFMLTINAAAQASTMCGTLTPADAVADPAALSAAALVSSFANLVPFAAPAPTVTCTMPSGANAKTPSLAILGLIAAFA